MKLLLCVDCVADLQVPSDERVLKSPIKCEWLMRKKEKSHANKPLTE